MKDNGVRQKIALFLRVITHKKMYVKLLFKLIICTLFFICVVKIFSHPKNIRIYKKDNPQIYYSDNNIYLTKETIIKFNSFIQKCHKGILINDIKYNKIIKPKITIIMPIYNGGKYLYYSLRSIQNQKMKDIEIILIDDCSIDNSIDLIEKYKEEDPRIILIKNKKNRKILYCKSIAALNAKGKYILQLDQDDMFASDEAFNILYNEVEKNDLDLLQFRDILVNKFHFTKKVRIGSNNYNHYINPHENMYLTQPQIKNGFFNNFNFLLWGLLIKTDIYKKGVYHLWPIIINYKIINFEDYTMTFMITVLAKTFKFINNFFLLHLMHKKSTTSIGFSGKEYHLSALFFVNNILEYYIKDNPMDVGVIARITPIIFGSKGIFPDFFEYVFKKIISNKYLSSQQKILYLNKVNVNNTFNFKIWNTYEYFMNSEIYNSIYQFQNLINSHISKNNKDGNFNPKFSIIIYCNKYEFLKKTINSINNQIFSNYEIILIYDNDNKKELTSINNLIINYNNIKMIVNNKMKGLLMSYFSGILQSKGHYIFTIKSGYTLANEMTLKELNNYINEKVEILEFNLLINNDDSIRNNSLELYKCSHFQSKINVDLIKFNKNYKEIDIEKELLINKVIKSEIYKDIINEYQNSFKDIILYNYYDDIILHLINKKGFKIKHIDIFGIIQYKQMIKILNLNINNKKQIIKDTLFFIDFLYNYSNNTIEAKKYAINEFYNNLHIIYNRFNVISEEAIKLIDKFLNSDYISQNDKNNLKLYYNSLKN